MILRLSFLGGQMEVIAGEAPRDFLGACRELAAEYPECRGTIVLAAVRGEAPAVDFHGAFAPEFQQKVRNIWALKASGQRLPERLDTPRPVFQVGIGEGRARTVLGSPPSLVANFCEAFARANPAAVARVTGLLVDGGVRLQVMGDMPELAQSRLLRRWDPHQETVRLSGPEPDRPKRHRVGVWVGGIVSAVIILGVALDSGLGDRVRAVTPDLGTGPFGPATTPFAAAPRPAEPPLQNGEVIEERGPTGPHTFYVDNRDALGFVARLVQRDGEVRRAFYVGPSQRAQVRGIPDGVYDVVFIQGRAFSLATMQFQSVLSVSRLDGPFEYATEAIPGGTRFWTKGVVTRAPQGRIKRYPVSTEWARK
jgi:hypothetical protein